MTDEQIDKLKRECEYWKHQAELGSDTTDRFARQLEEKEQKCEELKIEVEKWKSAFTLATKMLDNAEARANKLEQQLNQLKAENEELKERFKNFYDRKLDENVDLLCKLHKEECLKFKAEQKLIEIKTLANIQCSVCKEFSSGQKIICEYCNYKKVLKIIDEVG